MAHFSFRLSNPRTSSDSISRRTASHSVLATVSVIFVRGDKSIVTVKSPRLQSISVWSTARQLMNLGVLRCSKTDYHRRMYNRAIILIYGSDVQYYTVQCSVKDDSAFHSETLFSAPYNLNLSLDFFGNISQHAKYDRDRPTRPMCRSPHR